MHDRITNRPDRSLWARRSPAFFLFNLLQAELPNESIFTSLWSNAPLSSRATSFWAYSCRACPNSKATTGRSPSVAFAKFAFGLALGVCTDARMNPSVIRFSAESNRPLLRRRNFRRRKSASFEMKGENRPAFNEGKQHEKSTSSAGNIFKTSLNRKSDRVVPPNLDTAQFPIGEHLNRWVMGANFHKSVSNYFVQVF